MSFGINVVLFQKQYHSGVCVGTAMFHTYSVALGQIEHSERGNSLEILIEQLL